MPNTSATGGVLAPASAPAPLEGQALARFFQQWLSGMCGLPGTLFRPRWQAEPPNIPPAATAWAAFGITSRTADTFPYTKHHSSDSGEWDELQRHEELDILVSIYDLGTNGEADSIAALLRDGTAVAQNREPLFLAGMGLISVGGLTAVPSLLKERWLYRVDLPIRVRRIITRVYPVQDVVEGIIELEANNADTKVFIRNIDVTK